MIEFLQIPTIRRVAAVILLTALTACASAQSRREAAAELVDKAGWSREILDGGSFELFAAWKPTSPGRTLAVYLEGDGFAYVDAHHPSSDPTPTDPLALRLALADTRAVSVAYLGRPCQYVMPTHGRGCGVGLWTARRYAPEVIDASSRALDQLKARTGAVRLVLVGYSGGGALAALLAERRADVAGLVTVAANLDLAYWTRRDGLSPLAGSLDPAEEAVKLANLPQIHFAGGRDHVVGADVAQAFLGRLPPGAPARLQVEPEADHHCCWVENWPRLQAATGSDWSAIWR